MPEGVKLPIGQLYQANYDEHLAALRAVCKSLCHQYNQLDPGDRAGQMEILRRLLGTVGKEAEVMPPIWFDYGCNVHLGEKFYSNHDLIITDGAEVRFGDNVFVGPNCCFTTAEHPIDPELRAEGLEIALAGRGLHRAGRRHHRRQRRHRRGQRGHARHPRQCGGRGRALPGDAGGDGGG